MVRPKIKKPTVALIDEQKVGKRGVLQNAISFFEGAAGTSKTFLAVSIALDLYYKKEIDKIIISRPTVEAGKSMGFLPGDTGAREGKFAPYLAPVFSAFEKIIGDGGREIVDQMIDQKIIEVVPPQHLRGWNFENAFIIVDESQNLTTSQLTLIVSRLCNTAKLVFTLDDRQIDLPRKTDSCYYDLNKIRDVEGVFFHKLLVNHRHPLALKLIDIIYDENDDV